MNLHSRLRWLERVTVTGQPCAVCGLVPGERLPAGTKFNIDPPRVVEPITHRPVETRPEDFCAGCGRKLVFRLTLDRLG